MSLLCLHLAAATQLTPPLLSEVDDASAVMMAAPRALKNQDKNKWDENGRRWEDGGGGGTDPTEQGEKNGWKNGDGNNKGGRWEDEETDDPTDKPTPEPTKDKERDGNNRADDEDGKTDDPTDKPTPEPTKGKYEGCGSVDCCCWIHWIGNDHPH